MSALTLFQLSTKLPRPSITSVFSQRLFKPVQAVSETAVLVRLFGVLVWAALVSACSGKPVLDYDPQFQFDGLKYWSIVQVSDKVSTLDLQRVDAAVRSNLGKRYEFRETSPDFHVSYRIEEGIQFDQSSLSVGFGVSSGNLALGSRTQTLVKEKRVGKIRLDIVEPVSMRVIWTALSGEVLTEQMSTEARSRLIVREVSEMLDRFPPR